MALTVHGTVAPGFEPVADAFRANFTEHGELGASFAAWQGEELVVDLWAGLADEADGTPWQRDTLGLVFSATKGLVALAFLMLEDRGEIDLDQRVAWYWPEFGKAGKEGITVRQVLNHRAGLSAVDRPLALQDFADHRTVEAALVAQEPTWRPGAHQGYGATAWGMYTQAIFRRVAGRTVGAWLKDEVFDKLGADVHLGLAPTEHHRVATLYPVDGRTLVTQVLPEVARGETHEARVYRGVLLERGSLKNRAFLNPSLGPDRLNVMNEPWTRELELPWMNALCTARGLARVYAALANDGKHSGAKLVRKRAIEKLAVKQSWAYEDQVLVKPLGFAQGFQKEEPHLFSPVESAFGHPGAGGSFGWADPTHRIGMAYVPNRMHYKLRSPRANRLCRAMYDSLERWR